MPASSLSRHALKPSRLCYLVATGLLVTIFAWPALARDASALCDQAASDAARHHGVPLEVLRAVALLETGRGRHGTLRPWPWALNAGGTGYWLDSKETALAQARTLLASGRRNLDLGCFQLNYHWHGAHFATVADMLDPGQNADYAARYLLQHFQRLGDWKSAIGAYHSRTPEQARRYLARYDRIAVALATPATQPPAPKSNQSRQTHNGYALLTGAGAGALGSLVPRSVLQGNGRLISSQRAIQ